MKLERNNLVDYMRQCAKSATNKIYQEKLDAAANMLEADGPVVEDTKEVMRGASIHHNREMDQVRAELQLANATIVHLANSQRGLSESLKLEIRSRK